MPISKPKLPEARVPPAPPDPPPEPPSGVDYSSNAVAAAKRWNETDRQWTKIREIFRQYGRWIQ